MTDSFNVSGVDITPETDIKTMLRNEFLGAALFAGRYDEDPAPGVRSFVSAALETALRNSVLDALLGLLIDSDRKVRAGAAGTVLHFADKFDPSALLRVLLEEPKLFEGVPLSEQKGSPELDLAWTLLRAISAKPTKDLQVISTLRNALRHKNGSWILAGLVMSDAEWVADHPQEVLDADPARANIVLYRLHDPALRENFVRAVPKESPGLREAVSKAVSDEVQDTAERAHLLNLLAA